MREQLIAYLEGTLKPEECREVALRLQHSAQWRQELGQIQELQAELQQQMPLLGQPAPGQLDVLLSGILDRASRPRRSAFRWDGLQTILLVVGTVAVLVLFPLFLHNTSVDAMVNWSQNVPVSTNTMEPGDGTVEALYEPKLINIRYSASPVPMPGATLEPSREAVGK